MYAFNTHVQCMYIYIYTLIVLEASATTPPWKPNGRIRPVVMVKWKCVCKMYLSW